MLEFKQLTMCVSMLSRWDLQEGAELEDEEKAMVEELQKTFLVCSCSVGPQGSPGFDETPAKQTQGETHPPDKSAAQ